MSQKLASKISTELKRELSSRGLREDLIFVRSIEDNTNSEATENKRDLSNITVMILHRDSGDLPHIIHNKIESIVCLYLSRYHPYNLFRADPRYGSSSISFSQFLPKYVGDQISRDVDLVALLD